MPWTLWWIRGWAHSYAHTKRPYLILLTRCHCFTKWALDIHIILIRVSFHHSTCSFSRALSRIKAWALFTIAFGKIMVDLIDILDSWTVASSWFYFASSWSRNLSSWATFLLPNKAVWLFVIPICWPSRTTSLLTCLQRKSLDLLSMRILFRRMLFIGNWGAIHCNIISSHNVIRFSSNRWLEWLLPLIALCWGAVCNLWSILKRARWPYTLFAHFMMVWEDAIALIYYFVWSILFLNIWYVTSI